MRKGQNLAQSFKNAFKGLVFLCQFQRNVSIHAGMTLLAVGLGLWLQIPVTDWCWIVVAVSLVWAAEAFNTALEKLTDMASPDYTVKAKQIKDLAAAAVLILAGAAACVGLLILGFPLYQRFFP